MYFGTCWKTGKPHRLYSGQVFKEKTQGSEYSHHVLRARSANYDGGYWETCDVRSQRTGAKKTIASRKGERGPIVIPKTRKSDSKTEGKEITKENGLGKRCWAQIHQEECCQRAKSLISKAEKNQINCQLRASPWEEEKNQKEKKQRQRKKGIERCRMILLK